MNLDLPHRLTGPALAGLLCLFTANCALGTEPTTVSDRATTEDAEGWPTGDAGELGWNTGLWAELAERIEAGDYPETTSVLIAHRGRLVHEAYFGTGGVDVLNDTRSATKTVTALLVGAAIERELITGVKAQVYAFFPDLQPWPHPDPVKSAMTLEDLLTMSTMWECDDDNQYSSGNEERMYLSRHWTRFALDLPIKGFAPWQRRPEDSAHGRAFAYCTAAPFVLGAVLERSSGKTLANFAAEVLERPLGIEVSHWNRANEGVGMGGGGTRYRSRDLARIGQLLVDRGRWQGRQVVAAAWIDAMLSVRAQARDDADYGYQIWRFRFEHGDGEVGVWAMAGNGGNYVFIVPELRLVTVVTRTHYNQRGMHGQTHELFGRYVLKAMP